MKRSLLLLLSLAATTGTLVVGCKLDGVRERMANKPYLPGALRGLPPQSEPDVDEIEEEFARESKKK